VQPGQLAGVAEQVGVLAARAATTAVLDLPAAVVFMLDALREAGADEQVDGFLDRLPGSGMFEPFCRQEGRNGRFRFGREHDRSPAEPWGWEDLD
jgi:hypothetical protein